MSVNTWAKRLQKWRGEPIESELTAFEAALREIERRGASFASQSDLQLQKFAAELRERAESGISLEDLLVDSFALAREAARRTVGMRPFDVQIMAAAALHQGKLVEMQTGEGKTLVAVLPASLNALTRRGVHILTFNDYLARRDARWMGPIYRFLGLSVGIIQEGMTIDERRAAYEADVTYATAKEAGFDFLRMNLARDRRGLVHRGFHYAIVDEADSILIDEARSPLVIAGERAGSQTSPYRIAELVRRLQTGIDFETDENDRNAFLTERGIDQLESALDCGDLHDTNNLLLLTEVNQALHARALLARDVDYIVRDERIELIDEFTGRVVDDRRWPDGLQAALEAKECLTIRPGGRVLGSITLQHFLKHYSRLSGMTATAQTSAEEFEGFYGLHVVPVPPNRKCIREDLPDVIFTHPEAKHQGLIEEIRSVHQTGRPILVGTSSVRESELLASKLTDARIECEVLNAKNDEAEAAIIAQAGSLGAVTISTNMAGRGTDIRLGGAGEEEREQVVRLGGLYVIGTNRHESRRIDDQLRGRAGRQGDPGASRFFVSLEDDLMVRYDLDHLIPPNLRPARQSTPIDHPVIRSEVDRLQRIVDGQNYEIRKTLWRYSAPVEEHRKRLQDWRMGVLLGEEPMDLCATRLPERYNELCNRLGAGKPEEVERAVTLHHIDQCWAEHLAFITQLREGIHLEGLARKDPLLEFHKKIAESFWRMQQTIDDRIMETLQEIEIDENGIDLGRAGLEAPASTWTYLISDRALGQMQQMLFGAGSTAFAIGAVLTTWPLLFAWGVWERLRGKKTN